ncbi:ubiquitin--protein ligase [Ancylostoma ceylanicum]|uniref:Ubiquitin--protein ligase n=1 Tax=Ancylostoma ceylanicum TaxID=53326 RepID=A0A0D6L6Z3_9BILA|nr:ubiquitin--protein ligase [Ancylostoma ceylanicum]
MGSAASTSSPEPEETIAVSDRIAAYLSEKPLKMAHMLKTTKLINDCSPEEKVVLFESGIIQTICELIAETGSVCSNSRTETEERKRRQQRRNSNTGVVHSRGIGYGHGSTRSRWDIERTVEERLAREEHLTWLLNALNAFLYCSSPDFTVKREPSDYVHVSPSVVRDIGESAIIVLLEYHLKNDSLFDVSEHMELYQALLETAASLASIPAFVPYLVKPYTQGAKSIAKELLIPFKEIMCSYTTTWKDQMGSPDFRMVDFINKVETYVEIILQAAREYERTLPDEERIRTASVIRHRGTQSEVSLARKALESVEGKVEISADISLLYGKALKHLQMQSYKFIGDYGKLVIPYTFKKDIRNTNPFSPSLRERTKRIAKEIASMPNALPLNASNSIFVCVDEGRCDIIKVLISGPDDTPYANGLFEFDVFFPTSYPYVPPKCAFLTTGAGNVRFNPNLYNDGKICLSILGTWEGRPEEKWSSYCSLMQVLVSIQGLIFVKDPYFNEPGFEKYQGTEKGDDYSRKYNLQIEHATLNYAIRDQLKNPPEYFKKVIQRHFWLKRHAIIKQAKNWMVEMRKDATESERNPKRRESLTFETLYNPYHQERSIQQLISDLSMMSCPVDQCLKTLGTCLPSHHDVRLDDMFIS